MMKIKLILAMDKNNLVGNNNMKYGLPWHYPEDLKYYKEMTTSKVNVMGKNTYNAIGRALPNRETYVLSRTLDKLSDATVIKDISEVFKLDEKEVMITGGPMVFNSFIDYADEVLITKINKAYTGDVYYNDLDLSDFKLVDKKEGVDKDLVFEKWERNANFKSRD